MTLKGLSIIGGMCFAVLAALSTGAQAKSARCFATDDGYYPCSFQALGGSGSFRISAHGHPTIRMEMMGGGTAWGYVNFGHGEEAIPGEYSKDGGDGACWDNPDARKDKICAW